MFSHARPARRSADFKGAANATKGNKCGIVLERSPAFEVKVRVMLVRAKGIIFKNCTENIFFVIFKKTQ